MPKITIPETLTLTLPAITIAGGKSEPRTFSKPFVDFVLERLDDPRFGRTLSALEARLAIKTAIEGCKPGGELSLRQEDYSLLVEAVKEPSNAYVPALGEQILPYIYAIVNPR
jgi:hypothetical protein